MQQGAAGGQCTFSNKTFCACNNNLDNRDPIFRGTDEFLIILIFADNKCHHLEALLPKLARSTFCRIFCVRPKSCPSDNRQNDSLLTIVIVFVLEMFRDTGGLTTKFVPVNFPPIFCISQNGKSCKRYLCVSGKITLLGYYYINTKPKTAAVALNCKTKMAF